MYGSMAENEDGSSLIVNETSEEIESVNDEDESCDDPEADGDLEVLVKTDTECRGGTQGKTSTLSSTFLIVNAALGAGLLNFSQAFDEAGGILIAMVVQLVLLAFIMVALIILAVTSNVNYSNTLQDVMYTAAGVWGRRMTSLIVVLYSFGTCITFLIIIGDQFDRALASFVGPHFCDTWYLDRSFLMPASSVVFILPMCYTKKIDFLKYASYLGVFAMVYVDVLIIQEYMTGNHKRGEIKTKPDQALDFFLVMPVICFGYQCHVSVIPIYSCMKNRTTKHFAIASGCAIFLCVLTYTGAATFGYLTFGSLVKADILENYPAEKPAVMIALVMMALKMYTTYPILLFCGREGISSIITDLCCEDSERREIIRRVIIASVWFILTNFLAVKIPNIGAVIKVLGSLAAVFIFIFPGVCLLQTSLVSDPGMFQRKTKLKIFTAASFLIIGTFIFGVVLAQGMIYNMSSSHSHVPLCVPR